MFLDMDAERNDFIEITHIEKMTRVEDYNLGPQVSLSPGLSPKELTGTQNVLQLQSSYEQRRMIRDTHLLWGKFTYTGRNTFNAPQNQLYTTQAKYYYRNSPGYTLVWNGLLQFGESLDDDNLIKLGGVNGLRAYRRDEFTGSKSVLFNVEDRTFWVDDAFHLVSLGGVAFVDSGYAWARGQGVSIGDLKSDVGVGLRFGLTRSSNEVVVRLDVAYRMDRSSPNDPRFVVTFGTGQAF
jgi:hemolysin activation/secretion protein